MILLFVLLGLFFISCIFIDVTVDEDNEHEVAVARNLTLIGGGIMMFAVFAVALL